MYYLTDIHLQNLFSPFQFKKKRIFKFLKYLGILNGIDI